MLNPLAALVFFVVVYTSSCFVCFSFDMHVQNLTVVAILLLNGSPGGACSVTLKWKTGKLFTGLQCAILEKCEWYIYIM